MRAHASAFSFAAGVPLLLLVGCAGSAAEGAREFVTRFDTVAGVVHVRSAGEAPAARLDRIASIGVLGGVGDPGPDEFGTITSVVADRDGFIYVADAQAAEIRVFDETGRHTRTIGRRGEGPGEISSLYSLGWIGDTLAVLDPGNVRIGLFTRSGRWLGHFQHQPITGPVDWVRLHWVGDDGVATLALPAAGGAGRSLLFLRYRVGQEEPDTVRLAEEPEDLPRLGMRCPHTSGGGISFFTPPFAPRLLQTFTPAGAHVAARTDRYRIAFLDHGGDTLRIVAREIEPVPTDEAEWEDGLEDYREFRRNDPGARCEPPSVRRPAHRPPLRHVLFGPDGRMWTEIASADGFDVELFDADGRLLLRAPAPHRSTRVVPFARGNRYYIVAEDSLGAQSVEVYRIVSDPN